MKIKHKEFSNLGYAVNIALSVLLLSASAAIADDTEIFTAYTSTSPNSNVVFVLDTSGSMNNAPQGQSSPSKIQIVKDVFEKLIFDPDNPTDHSTINPNNNGLKFALMRFDSGGNGGYFITKMQTLNDGSKRNIWDVVGGTNGLTAGGNTPLAETAYEAARYFRGDTPYYGNSSSPGTNIPAITSGSSYKSPFDNLANGAGADCAINNHLVILTDGMPTNDDDADSLITTLSGLNCSFSSDPRTDCLPQVAQYLRDTDFLPNIDGVQNVRTHTIAFDLQQAEAVAMLQQTASNGDGIHLSATGSGQLSDAITEVIRNVNASAKSFVSPAVSVSDTNRFVHDNTLYFGMFEPAASPKWTGNLKGYDISESGEILDYSQPPIAALDSTGEIVANARSKWSVAIDGAEIGAGGAASRIGLARNLFTQNASNGVVSFSSANITETDLGAANTAEKDAIINWASGKTDNGASLRLNPIGDPLHSKPQVVTYCVPQPLAPCAGTTSVIFFGTNEGFLHAIDADTGLEKFALIPRSLLGNLKTFKDDILGNERPYGLDGHITVYRKDADGDKNITTNGNDEVLLIVTMRRGGNQVFAFDVTDPDHPSLKWQISGGSTEFPDLGQTWSKPLVTKLNIGNINNPSQEEVVLFAGGYDDQYDDPTFSSTVPNSSISGNAIYAVGLHDGLLKWSATGGSSSATATSLQIPELTDAIPSDVTYLDVNSDGITDRIYVIDIVGRVFRIDFNTTRTTGGTTQYIPNGKLFADLSGGTRRHYYAVDLVYSSSGLTPRLYINVGSGHRAHPLDLTSEDRFFSVWDEYVRAPLPDNFSAHTINDLTPTNTAPTTTIDHGWYFDLPPSEKVLSMAGTVYGYTFFTTYTPPPPPTGPTCTPPTGTGKFYAVKLFNSEALGDDRARTLQANGIPPSPAFMSLAQTNNNGGNQPSTTTNPLSSTMTRYVVLSGTENPLTDEEEDKLNSGIDTFKTYWETGN
jgi:type IV pilus assembly protein PilY1